MSLIRLLLTLLNLLPLRHRILIECTNFKQGTQQSAGEEDVIVMVTLLNDGKKILVKPYSATEECD